MNKIEFISGKNLARLKTIPSIIGMVVLTLFIMTVGFAWISGGYLSRAVRRKLHNKTPMDWYTIAGRSKPESSPFAATVGSAI